MEGTVVEVIKLKLTFSHSDGTLVNRKVECHFWLWCGDAGDAIDCYEVRSGRLVKTRGFNNVSEVEEV